MHTRRQILKCLAALPVVGPMLPDVAAASSTAGAAAAHPILPVLASDEILTGFTIYNDDISWMQVLWDYRGISQSKIDQALAAADAGRHVSFNVSKKVHVDSCDIFPNDVALSPFSKFWGIKDESVVVDHIEDLRPPCLTPPV